MTWPFVATPAYRSSPSTATPAPGTSFVCAPSSTPTTHARGVLVVDIPSPDLTGAAAHGAGAKVIATVPPGATRYRLGFAPQQFGMISDVLPIAVDIAPDGPIVGSQIAITPMWARLTPAPIPASAVTATLIVVFE